MLHTLRGKHNYGAHNSGEHVAPSAERSAPQQKLKVTTVCAPWRPDEEKGDKRPRWALSLGTVSLPVAEVVQHSCKRILLRIYRLGLWSCKARGCEVLYFVVLQV